MICTTQHASPRVYVIKLPLKYTAVAWLVELHQQFSKVYQDEHCTHKCQSFGFHYRLHHTCSGQFCSAFLGIAQSLKLFVQAPRDAKQQIEDAMMAVMEKRHAMDDAAHGQSSNAV